MHTYKAADLPRATAQMMLMTRQASKPGASFFLASRGRVGSAVFGSDPRFDSLTSIVDYLSPNSGASTAPTGLIGKSQKCLLSETIQNIRDSLLCQQLHFQSLGNDECI